MTLGTDNRRKNRLAQGSWLPILRACLTSLILCICIITSIFLFQTDIYIMWNTRVPCPRDHSGAWSWKGSGLVGTGYSHLRDVGGVSYRERDEGRGKEGGRERAKILLLSLGTLLSSMSTRFASTRKSWRGRSSGHDILKPMPRISLKNS